MKIRPVLTLVCVGLGAAAAVTANLEQAGPTAIKEKRDESVWDRALLEQRQNLELNKREAQSQNFDITPRHSSGHIAADRRDENPYHKRDASSGSPWAKRSAFSLPGVPGKFSIALLARRREQPHLDPGFTNDDSPGSDTEATDSPTKRGYHDAEDMLPARDGLQRGHFSGELNRDWRKRDPEPSPGGYHHDGALAAERRNKNWRRAHAAANAVEKRGELSGSLVEPRGDADAASPDGKGVTRRDDASPDGKGVTRRDDASPDGKGVTRRDDASPDGKGVTRRDDASPDGKGVTRRDDASPDGKGVTKRDDANPDGKGATKRDDASLYGKGATKRDDANLDGKGATKRDADVDSDGNTLDWAGPTRRGKRDGDGNTADWAGPTRRRKRDSVEDTADWAGPTRRGKRDSAEDTADWAGPTKR